mmetsp:Transcript_65471/g.184909  ORF Transcript_65471/g.184909 Transcript_65471/m.184909 type:complete len:82 (-) Transcript_65471:55-300(-)
MGFVGGGQIQGFAGCPAEVAAAVPQGSLRFCLFFVCRLSLQQTVVYRSGTLMRSFLSRVASVCPALHSDAHCVQQSRRSIG